MKKLKKRWEVESNTQIVLILLVFSITGSISVKIAEPLTNLLGIPQESTPLLVYWPIRIVMIFCLYQLLLVGFGWLFGQYRFFWNFEKKMLKRIGLRRLIKE